MNIESGNFLEANDLVDPETNETIKGYYFKNNCKIKIFSTNTDVLAKPINVKNYYYRDLDGYSIKILNLENVIKSGDEYQVIPDHTYTQLKNADRLKDRLFAIECFFDKEENGLIVNEKETIYFKLLSEEEYKRQEEYIKNRKSSVINKKIE